MSKGFTLIELLVVISIIAILSMIGLISYSNFMKNSRDSKRQSDLKMIQSALEDYHADQLYYPPTVTPGSPLTFSGTSNTKSYMTTVPKDPLQSPAREYSYVPSGCADSKCRNYCLFANLENLPPPPKTEDPVNCPNSDGYNYAVTRP